MPEVTVALVSDLVPLVGHQVRIEGWTYAVWLLRDGSVCVLDNACKHVGSPLVDGAIEDGCVVCPWHGWRFDLRTGEHRTGFGPLRGVGTYPARIVGRKVVAELPDRRPGPAGAMTAPARSAWWRR